jgi:TRAP-type C4-dicarboxylate transport system substrate-binding protein
MKPTRALTAAAALLAAFVTLAGPTERAEAQIVMKMANATINDVQHEWQKLFAEEMGKRVGDKVKVEIYPASQLGSIPRMTEGVLLGTIESFISPTSFLTNTDPKFEIFDVPGLFKSPEHVHAVIHDPTYRDHFETMFLDRDLRVIGAIYNSSTLILTKNEVTSIEGLKGQKIRTFATPLQMDPLKAVGVLPVPLALTEVIPQLQSGGIDGVLAGMPILTAFKYYDAAKYVIDLNFAQIVSVNVVNETWFQSQPADIQQAIRAAGRAAEERAFPWGVANLTRSSDAWLANGGKIAKLPDIQQQAMMAQFQQIGLSIISGKPAVKAEYDQLKKLVDAKAMN